MRRDLIYSGQRLVVALLLALGLSSSGCSDSVSVSEDVRVPLASLVITPGTLQPGFFSNTTSYKVNAPTSADSVTVTATPRNSAVEVTINGLVTAAGQGRSISLGTPGSITTITIVLFSQTTGSETTYTINVTRLLSSDDNLTSLSVAEGTLKPSPFNADTLDYTVDVAAANVGSVNVSATKSDPSASMLIGSKLIPAGTESGQAPIAIGGPGTVTPVSIVVTAPNGSKKTYRIMVNHLSNDNTLRDLRVIPGPLDPSFDKGTLPYTVDVATNIDSVRVTAWLEDTAATMTMNNQGISSGQARDFPLDAAPSILDINILVTAPNGSQNTYTIKVNRLAPSSNTNLSSLIVTTNPLGNPVDHQVDLTNQQPYLVDVATDVATVTVTATLEDINATMTINGQGILSGSPSQLISLGDPGSYTPIIIEVRAQNLVDTNTYTVRVHRAASSNSNLSALSVTPGALDPNNNPFDPNRLSYTVNVDSTVDNVVISATKADLQATMSFLGSVIAAPGDPDGQVPVTLGAGPSTEVVTIRVIAQDTTSETLYTITINRAPSTPTP